VPTRSCLPKPPRPQLTWFLVSLVFVGDGALRDGFPVAAQQGSGALAAVASFCAAVSTEIYLRCNIGSCQEILRRNGRGQLSPGFEVWRGYHQSLHSCQGGLMLNLDVAAAAFV
jgi:hypothetical protein